jgi:hypothetical protein
MALQPTFSVVMATFNRGRSILPSLRSVMAQIYPAHEVLVLGDGCSDATGTILQDTFGDRLTWLNLPQHKGSQSYPNNSGIMGASGSHIAYLGHDDIWAPDHLARLAAVYAVEPQVDVAVSGCAFHLPHGMPAPYVTGLFDTPDAAGKHFFPPSSFSHRRDLTDRIGPWRDPFICKAPVDCDLLLRAVAQGCKFRSTGQITTHKFAAGHRYLSYLWHDTTEQDAALGRLALPGVEDWLQSLVQTSQAAGRFMVMTHPDFSTFAPGDLARENQSRKGLRAQAVPLTAEQVVPVPSLPWTLDWCETPDAGILWSIGNPRPRILVPVSGTAQAILLAEFAHTAPDPLARIDGRANSILLRFQMGPALPQIGRFIALGATRIALQPDAPTALELALSGAQIPQTGAHLPKPDRGLGHGRLFVLPLPDLAQTAAAVESNRTGLALNAAGETAAAIAAFRAAIAASSLNVVARSNLALLLAAAGQQAEALDQAWIAATLQPRHLPAWVAMGRVAVAEGATDAAEHIARQIATLDTGAPVAAALRDAIKTSAGATKA